MQIKKFETPYEIEHYYKQYIESENLTHPLYSWETYLLCYKLTRKLYCVSEGVEKGDETYVAFQNEKVVGIITLILTGHPNIWGLTTDLFPAQVLTIKPEILHEFVAKLPQAVTFDDVAFWYGDKTLNQYWFRLDANIAKLGNSLEDYLMTIKKKARNNFRKILKLNSDLDVIESCDTKTWNYLLKKWHEMWKTRNFESPIEKTTGESKILDWLASQNCLLELTILDHGNPIAANRSIIDGNHLRDIMCVRHETPEYLKRSIGMFAILKNIEFAIKRGIKYYDLGTQIEEYDHTAYKGKFSNTDKKIICGASFKQELRPPYYDIDRGEWLL